MSATSAGNSAAQPAPPAVPAVIVPATSAGLVVFGLVAFLGFHFAFQLVAPTPIASDHCRVSEVTATVVRCKSVLETTTDGKVTRQEKLHIAKAVTEEDKKRISDIKAGAIFPVSQFVPPPPSQGSGAAGPNPPPAAPPGAAPIAVPTASVSGLEEVSAKPGTYPWLFALVGTGLFLWMSAGFSKRIFTALLIGADGKLSTSKVQSTLWLVSVVGFWHFIVMMRFSSGMEWTAAMAVTLSADLLAVAGLSAVTTATAKVAASTVKDVPPTDIQPCWNPIYLFCDDEGKLDAADTQMVVVTVISLTMFLVSAVAMAATLRLTGQADLAAPPEVMKYLLGASLSTYLVPKISDVITKLKS